ncbi:MAG: CRISPR-associated helicase/endonuclease Cas3 [gamma proteobacterium endosymbiont of Lamellibrachia anaximandri]|nr:CRISPR-associated helicase/endonuclease Cas3 [gamma proteobacterium endosymbiont of Lamellibrachia anaximandri]
MDERNDKQTGALALYYRYWGKASKEYAKEVSFHLLPYHCLDVAAVAAEWWAASPALRHLLCKATDRDESTTQAWVLYFITLHDFGKLDIRFQLKSPATLQVLQPGFNPDDADTDPSYYHGQEGYSWFVRDAGHWKLTPERLDQWKPWLQAVTGHHGSLPRGISDTTPDAEKAIIEQDVKARLEFITDMAEFFLTPAGLSLKDTPPLAPDLLAGFCSISDWLGSDEEKFPYCQQQHTLKQYWQRRLKRAHSAIHDSGLIGKPLSKGGMAALYPNYHPRQVQTLIEKIPCKPGITLIEAPTGSGKTEAALAYAANLLANGTGEAIIFALPTQATANAMFKRLQNIAKILFPSGNNLLLAHGRAKYHPGFSALKDAAGKTAQGDEEAVTQCVEWLGASRKRAFLGQIGVCTIDQVFLSVLPVRHQFVRAFGVRKAVLIIDEVHAYDAYMYGLLVSVLQGQQQNGGSAILLSATLPAWQKALLLGYESDNKSEQQPYPLIIYCESGKQPETYPIEDETQYPPLRLVETTCRSTADMLPDNALVSDIIHAAESGALVAVICNLVADAQQLAKHLQGQCKTATVDLFHSRFRFTDRQQIELEVLHHYGHDADHRLGRILVATQVIEQSLDLDFDWMITQLSPVDLLFQRIGRLHRHERELRPPGHEVPRCTILIPEGTDYELHELIYGYRRILWRTQMLLEDQPQIEFPASYRDWIEQVYQAEPWEDEPRQITDEANDFLIEQDGNFYTGKQLANVAAKPLPDTEGAAGRLTRDGEMSLTVVLATKVDGEWRTLEGGPFETLEDWQKDEAIDLNSLGVPNSWRKYLPPADEQGRHWLLMYKNEDGIWCGKEDERHFKYAAHIGLLLSKEDDIGN